MALILFQSSWLRHRWERRDEASVGTVWSLMLAEDRTRFVSLVTAVLLSIAAATAYAPLFHSGYAGLNVFPLGLLTYTSPQVLAIAASLFSVAWAVPRVRSCRGAFGFSVLILFLILAFGFILQMIIPDSWKYYTASGVDPLGNDWLYRYYILDDLGALLLFVSIPISVFLKLLRRSVSHMLSRSRLRDKK